MLDYYGIPLYIAINVATAMARSGGLGKWLYLSSLFVLYAGYFLYPWLMGIGMIGHVVLTIWLALRERCYILLPFLAWNLFLFIPVYELAGIGQLLVVNSDPYLFERMLWGLHRAGMTFVVWIFLPILAFKGILRWWNMGKGRE